MKTSYIALATFGLGLVAAQSAFAVGLDRSGQRIGVLFETGNHAELSFGFTSPSLDGTGLAFGAPTGNVADDFRTLSGGVKVDLSDQWSVAFIIDEPYGSDIFYQGDPATTILGGTGATVDSTAYTALARYKFNSNFSVHAGLRYQEVSATVTTAGFAFNGGVPPGSQAGTNGYQGNFGSDGAFGYVLGVAYEIPDIALRVSLTYNSGTDHDLPTTETIRGIPANFVNPAFGATSTTPVSTPESLNLAFQTGIAADTLLFGSIRYASYSDTTVSPELFTGVTGSPLTDLEDGFDVEIGVGRRFNDKWSGLVSFGRTTVGDDNIVSPLGPNNGSSFISVGARYNVSDTLTLSGGVRYTKLGDAFSSPGGTPAASFTDNSAISAGFRVGFKF